LSADHGIGSIPEVARARGKEAGRVSPELFTTRAEELLDETFAAKGEQLPGIEQPAAACIYLNQALLKERRLEPARVERARADWLMKQTGVERAVTRAEL